MSATSDTVWIIVPPSGDFKSFRIEKAFDWQEFAYNDFIKTDRAKGEALKYRAETDTRGRERQFTVRYDDSMYYQRNQFKAGESKVVRYIRGGDYEEYYRVGDSLMSTDKERLEIILDSIGDRGTMPRIVSVGGRKSNRRKLRRQKRKYTRGRNKRKSVRKMKG